MLHILYICIRKHIYAPYRIFLIELKIKVMLLCLYGGKKAVAESMSPLHINPVPLLVFG